ncbi:MAG: hypothetical protein AUH42_06180 [Gemmatimonadetes bacterium 13_1_40CM_70_11]|nr:MAG: hypothetical protein AUH42_06180 [Gemmatimonadetes bacterium 13_1_40CM_70_11]
MGAMDSTDRNATAAAHEAMSGPMRADPHLRMTPSRRGTAADSARAAALVAQIREALGKYRDVRVADADGFRQFLPGVRQPVYHFTNWLNALGEGFRFDPAKPTSLLYRRKGDGSFELIGAMYADRARATEDELDGRIPLSVAHWHEHVNWCVPPRGQRERWRETRAGRPVFGPRSAIADAAACAAVGGRFLPRIFGWMVHIQAFASDDPAVIWSTGHDHDP